jgi:hypothetical protein
MKDIKDLTPEQLQQMRAWQEKFRDPEQRKKLARTLGIVAGVFMVPVFGSVCTVTGGILTAATGMRIFLMAWLLTPIFCYLAGRRAYRGVLKHFDTISFKMEEAEDRGRFAKAQPIGEDAAKSYGDDW